jgi:hypothetical protein
MAHLGEFQAAGAGTGSLLAGQVSVSPHQLIQPPLFHPLPVNLRRLGAGGVAADGIFEIIVLVGHKQVPVKWRRLWHHRKNRDFFSSYLFIQ